MALEHLTQVEAYLGTTTVKCQLDSYLPKLFSNEEGINSRIYHYLKLISAFNNHKKIAMSLDNFPRISEQIEFSLFWKRNLEYKLKYDQDLLNKVVNMLTDSEFLKYLGYVHSFETASFLKMRSYQTRVTDNIVI